MAKPVRIESWWRIETDDEGKVVSARVVEAAGKDRGGVFYVRAKTEAAAGKAAFNAYYRLRLRARRAKLRAEGKCDCGRERNVSIPGTKEVRANCSVCLEGMEDSRQRRARREAGEVVSSPDKSETLKRRRDSERAEHRLDVLREVNRRFLALPKSDFMRWLQRELDALVGKKVA